ncbi:MAG: GNAT family N-acetyltransferase [Gemmataceae bacterium]|nr:GNAT family N-acetyltransferase [Gemmataceae bacterium]
MTQPVTDLRPIAHAALSLTEPPYLKHYRHSKFKVWNGVALHASELPGPGFNFAAVLVPDAPSLDELLPVAREFFADAEQGWGVLVEGDAGHPMEAQLRSRGWRVDEDEPAYVLEDLRRAGSVSDRSADLRSLTRPARPGPGSPSLALRLARAETDRQSVIAVTGAAFGAPPDFADLFSPPGLFADPGIGHLLGSVDGEDVAAVMFAVVGPTAVIAGTATREAHRGNGYGAALVAAASAEAAARGCTSAALRSGPKSRPLYERLGFRYVCQHRTYAAPPG